MNECYCNSYVYYSSGIGASLALTYAKRGVTIGLLGLDSMYEWLVVVRIIRLLYLTYILYNAQQVSQKDFLHSSLA